MLKQGQCTDGHFHAPDLVDTYGEWQKNHVNLFGISITVAALLIACLAGCRPHCGSPAPYLTKAEDYDVAAVEPLPAKCATAIQIYPLALRALEGTQYWEPHYAFDIGVSGPTRMTGFIAARIATDYASISEEVGDTQFISRAGTVIDWSMSNRFALAHPNIGAHIELMNDGTLATHIASYTVCSDDLTAASEVTALLSENLSDAIAGYFDFLGVEMPPVVVVESRIIPVIR